LIFYVFHILSCLFPPLEKGAGGFNNSMNHTAISFRSLSKTVALLLLIFMNAAAGYGGDFHNALSLQGFTGLLNTPNAAVTNEGKAYLLFSNQKEDRLRDLIPRQEAYMFSVGLLSFAEIGGRLTDLSDITHDLSANFKIKVPFIPKESYFPQIAFGIQDVGSGARFFQTNYVVASEELWRFRFSLGYGKGPDRMKGTFGGVELKACDWLYLLAENDTKENNLGLRLVTPKVFGWPVNVQMTAKTSLDYQTSHPEIGIGLQFPLGSDRHNRKPRPEKAVGIASEVKQSHKTANVKEIAAEHPRLAMTGNESLKGIESAAIPASATDNVKESKAVLPALRKKLAAAGFENVRVGTDPAAAILVVEFENSRYNHNELDGLGVVLNTVVDTVPPTFEILQLITRKKGIRMLQLNAPLAAFREFLYDPDKEAQLDAHLAISSQVVVDDRVSFIDGTVNPSWLKSEVVLFPALKTFVGTEGGMFDYLLSLKPDYYLNLWKGAIVNARWDFPIDWSDNFDDGQIFRNSRKDKQFERLAFFQAFKVTPDLMLNVGGGTILKDINGTINELMWTPGSGHHRFELKYAYLSSSEKEAAYQHNRVYVGAYRYYYSPLDLYMEVTAGQFLDQDRGFTVELKRFFGDTAFSIYYKNSETETKEHVQVAGVQIALPLTPRRDMKPYLLRVRGSDEWGYAQETKIVSVAGTNFLNTSIGVNPQVAYNLERVFYNRDRLTEDYIRKHLLRLRQ